MYKSLTTPDKKFGLTMHLVERIVLSKYKPAAFFWSKKECRKLDNRIYTMTSLLIQAIRCVSKKYSDEVLVKAFNGLNFTQLKKICEMATWQGNLGKIIAGLTFYADKEQARLNRLAMPKDKSLEAEPVIFEPGQDLRKNITHDKKKRPLWALLKGTGVEIYGKEEGSNGTEQSNS